MANSGTFRKGDGRPRRKKGVPNKTTLAAREAFQHAFDQIGGPEALGDWAKNNPTEFYKLFARLIPVDVQASGGIGLTVEIVKFGEKTNAG